MNRLFCLMLASTALATLVTAAQPDQIWGFKIPMRDGIQLNGPVFRAHEQLEIPIMK